MDFGTPLRTFFKKLTGLPRDPDIKLRLQKTCAKARTMIWVMKIFQPIRIKRSLKKSKRLLHDNGPLNFFEMSIPLLEMNLTTNPDEILINAFVRKLLRFPYFGCATKSDF